MPALPTNTNLLLSTVVLFLSMVVCQLNMSDSILKPNYKF